MKKIWLIFFLFHFLIPNSKAQWFIQQSGTTDPLYDIEFINKSTGWCSGEGIILKTTDGGLNWINKLNDAPIKPYSAIYPVDSNLVYAVGFFRTFIKTTNGGNNWIVIENGNPGEGDYYSIFFLNSYRGWVGVNYGSGIVGVRKTTDGGITFFISQTTGIPQDLYFKDSLNGIGVGEVSYTYRTTNGGLNWMSNSIVFNGNFYRVSFINENTGYTASRRAVYITTNFGISWDSVGRITPLDISVQSIEFCNKNIGWAGTTAPVYKTTDGGRNWFLQFVTGVVYSIYSFNDSLVWTCGNGGRIWNTTTGGISFINNISSALPYDLKLFQNYPNPFNSQTKITFSIKQFGNYSLEIYNYLGQKIIDLFNKKISAGIYETIFDASDLNSGVYFYKLNGNNLNLTKKFIIIK